MNRVALLAAVVAAGIGVALLFLYLKRIENETRGGEPVEVVVALADIPLGKQISGSMLTTQSIPSAYIESRHIRAVDKDSIIGLRVRVEVKGNEAVLWSNLATSTGDRRDLSSLVSQNSRGFTLRAQSTASFGGLLRPGDRVDVVWAAQREERIATVTLLQNLLVLAVGGYTGGDRETVGDGNGDDTVVTLSTTPQQAEWLAFANENGRLSLTLRNPDDTSPLQRQTETTWESFLSPVTRAEVQRREPVRAIVAPTEPAQAPIQQTVPTQILPAGAE